MTYLIALHGHHGVGKDALGAMFMREGFHRFAFADLLWVAVGKAFGVAAEFASTRECKEQATQDFSLIYCENPDYRKYMFDKGFDLLEPRTSRFHAHHYCNDFLLQKHGKRLWVNEAIGALSGVHNSIPLVCTDLRTYDDLRELTALKMFSVDTGRRMVVVEVTRDGCTAINHESDRRLPDHHIDLTLPNNGALSDTFTALQSFLANQ